MERQQYGLKVDLWNVNWLSEERASDDLLQNEIRKYDIFFLGEAWQYKDNLDNFPSSFRIFPRFCLLEEF